MLRRTLLRLPAVALLQPSSTSDARLAAEALEQARTLLAAIVAGRVEQVAARLADDFFYVNSNGTTADRAQFVARLREGALTYTDLALRAPTARAHGEQVVVITGELHIEGRTAAGPVIVDVIVTQVWMRAASGFTLTTHHTTKKA